MIPNDKPLRWQTIDRMLKAIIRDESWPATEWERDFVLSINEQFAKKENLSNKQCDILERIYDKGVQNG